MAAEQKVTEQPEAVTEPETVAPEVPEAEKVEKAELAPRARKAKERRETFEAVRPDGTVVIVDRNVDTGEQTVTEK